MNSKNGTNFFRIGNRKTKLNYVFILGLIQSILIFPLFAQSNVADVMKAYEIRISGKDDDAKEILNTVLKKDATNAMAYFEMARTTSDENKVYFIEKALIYDPDNLMYRFYKANYYMLTAYKAMKTNDPQTLTKNIENCTQVLKGILELYPNCKESLLFLVEINGTLPEEMGGNIEEAHSYLKRLKTIDPVYGARGESMLLSKEADFDIIKYWHKFIETNGETVDALINLGKANLLKNNIDDATLCFNKVLAIDASQNQLHLDLARAHLYNAMRRDEQTNSELIKLKKSINRYLDTKVNQPVIIKAWCYGWLGKADEILGNKKQARKHFTKAEKLIPDFPKYTAIPVVDHPPNSKTYTYKSYFTPF